MDEVRPVIGSICKPNRIRCVVLCADLATGTGSSPVRSGRITPENKESFDKLEKPTD